MNKLITPTVKDEVIFGIHPIIELLKAKRRKLHIIYTTKPAPKKWGQIAELLPKHIQVQPVEKAFLNRLAGTEDHQSVVALAAPFVTRKKHFDPKKHKFLLMLDEIQDTKNLGAILRSAYCTKVDGVIITQKGSSPISAAAIKSSAGLAEHMEIMLVSSASQAVAQLKASGYSLYLATVDNSKNMLDVEYQFPLCIVIGNEAMGVSKSILGSGQHITLPQCRSDISYNASVAAGIIMFNIATKYRIL